MKKQILIVDSEDRQLHRIEKVLQDAAEEIGVKIEIHTANTIAEADLFLQEYDIDTLILDTVYRGFKFGEYQGIKWVEEIRKIDRYVLLPVIFIASVGEPREYAYTELNCLGFLPRVFDTDQLMKVLRKALYYTTYRDEENYVLPKKRGMLYPIKVKDIVYVEMADRLLHIYMLNEEMLEIPHQSMVDFAKEAESKSLVQCNKRMLVNKAYVSEVDLEKGHLLLMFKGEKQQLPIGKQYLEVVKKAFHLER